MLYSNSIVSILNFVKNERFLVSKSKKFCNFPVQIISNICTKIAKSPTNECLRKLYKSKNKHKS